MMSENRCENHSPILVPGRNCWTAAAPVHASGLLIDGRNYYRSFYRAAQQAQRYLLIAGWKFTSDVRLLRGIDAADAGGEVHFLPFLQGLLRQKPDLRIYVLAWDFSAIYSWEWEAELDRKFNSPDGRLQFRFDNHHPFGASHHQKFAVVDGSIGFVGGFDFNGDDWDDRDHRPHHPERGDGGTHHGPYHDVQACLVGAAAEELARYFQMRWLSAGHEKLDLPPARATHFGDVGLPVASTRVALSLNQPWTAAGASSVNQIKQLYCDAIAAARSLIYIENQYVTAEAIADALEGRMRNAGLPLLDIAIIQPKQLPGWVEAATLEPLRLKQLDELARVAAATGHRLGFYYSAAGPQGDSEVATLIHSKVMIVDDRFLTVGSANLSNRSQGLDTELNASWEAGADEEELRASIRQVRADLLAEHCGLCGDRDAMHILARSEGLVALLDHITTAPWSRLRPLRRSNVVEDRPWLTQLERLGFSLDPARPIIEELL